MAEDPKEYQEEEYVFSDEGTETEESSDEEAAMPNNVPEASFADKLIQKRKQIFIGVGLIVVVFLAYKIISSFMGGSTTDQNPLSPPVQPAAPVQVSVPVAPPVLPQTTHNDEQEKRLLKVEMDTDGVRRELDDMANTNTNLQASIDQINVQLTQLNTMVAVLTDKVQSLEQAVPKKVVTPVKSAPPKPVVKMITYSVMAVIPGRAWLKASDGSTLTVAQGTMIPGYGTVISINPQQGLVNMSSGKIIQFSTNEL